MFKHIAIIIIIIAINGCSRPKVANETEYSLYWNKNQIGNAFKLDGTIKSFYFHMPVKYKWTDYRDDEPETNIGDNVKIDIWLAGKDIDADIIGFSVLQESKNRILMNAVSVYKKGRKEKIEIIKNFYIQKR